MAHSKDYFPILKRMIRPEEIFFDFEDVVFLDEFRKTAQTEEYLYVWFDKSTQALKATFKQPDYFLSLTTDSGWCTAREIIAFGATPTKMNLTRPFLVTIFKKGMIVDKNIKGLCEKFIKKLQKIDLIVSVNI